jgi:hypothetical protein
VLSSRYRVPVQNSMIIDSSHLADSKMLESSVSTVTEGLNGVLSGLDVSKDFQHKTLYDTIILFLTSVALDESSQFRIQKTDFAEIISRFSDWITPEFAQLSTGMEKNMRLQTFFFQLSGLVAGSTAAQNSMTNRITEMLNDFFKKALSAQSVYTFINHDPTSFFGDLVISNFLGILFLYSIVVIRLALNSMMKKSPDFKKGAIYIPQDDCGTWNNTHYPEFLLPKDISLTIRLIPNEFGTNQIDSKNLRDIIEADKIAGIHPILIVCRAGTELCNQHDDLLSITAIKKENNCWTHLQGVDTLFYCFLDNGLAKSFDSLDLNLDIWYPDMMLPKMVI